MKHAFMAGIGTAWLYLGLAAPLLAAEPPPADGTTGGPQVSAAKPATACLYDLVTLNSQMTKDGYWLGGSSYGFGYGYGYPMGDYPATVTGYHNARPGHEIRILVASANILAHQGNLFGQMEGQDGGVQRKSAR